jgi:hypothetical protein
MSVGVTKDYKLKVRNLHASHESGCCLSGYYFFLIEHGFLCSQCSQEKITRSRSIGRLKERLEGDIGVARPSRGDELQECNGRHCSTTSP